MNYKQLLFKGLSYYGGVVLAYKVLKQLGQLYSRYLKRKQDLAKRYGENSWAVVTGCSSGIGKAFCYELAKKNFNICLIARKREALETISQELQTLNPKIQTKIILCDFENFFDESYVQTILTQLNDLDISILVNNAGVYQVQPNYYHQMDNSTILQVLKANVMSNLMITHHIIPTLLKRKQRGAIINLSSVKSYRPFYFDTMYSSTKVFIDNFSRILAKEYEHKIDVLTLRPNFVQTNMVKKPPKLYKIMPDQCAQSTLSQLGNSTETDGPFKHYFWNSVICNLPNWFIYKYQNDERNLMNKILQKRKENIKVSLNLDQ